MAAVDDEMAALSRAKAAAEDELEARHFDLETAQEALALREARLGREVVRDDVEETLKQVRDDQYGNRGAGGPLPHGS